MARYSLGHQKRNRNNSGSKIITLIIYVLTCYIVLNLLYSSVGKFFSQELLVSGIKKIAGSNLLYVDYIVKEDRDILMKNTSKKDFLNVFLNNPASDYYEKKVPINVAENSTVNFCLSDSIIMRGKESSYSEETPESEVLNSDMQKDTEGENVNNNEEQGNSESNNSADNQAGVENVSGSITGFKKMKEIKTEELSYDYLMSKFYTVVSGTTLYPEDIDSTKLMNIDMKMATTNDKPQILIYHTHAEEGFTDSVSGDKNTGIVGVGNYLTEILTNQYGYNVIHLTDSFDLINGVLDRIKAYDYAY